MFLYLYKAEYSMMTLYIFTSTKYLMLFVEESDVKPNITTMRPINIIRNTYS